MPTSSPKFVHVLLCDNDFGQHLEKATRQVFEATKANCTEEAFNDCVVYMTSALVRLEEAARTGQKCQDTAALFYLQNKLRVVYSESVPAVDHDGGSVAVDTYTGYVWRF